MSTGCELHCVLHLGCRGPFVLSRGGGGGWGGGRHTGTRLTHLNEKKVVTLSDAAVITDEFVLMHRRVFPSVRQSRNRSPVDDTVKDLVRAGHLKSGSWRKPELKRTGDKRVCFYCLDPGHLISECRSWKQKNSSMKAKSVAFVKSSEDNDRLDSTSVYQPFLMSGFVSLSADSEVRPITILRDTGAAQSIILDSVLPFSAVTYTGSDVLVHGIELGCVKLPLHTVCLTSDLNSGVVELGVRSELPVEGVGLVLGNDLAGGKVFSSPVVVETPEPPIKFDFASLFPLIFPACAVTRAQSRKFEDVVNLSESFMNSSPELVECKLFVTPSNSMSESDELNQASELCPLKIGRE